MWKKEHEIWPRLTALTTKIILINLLNTIYMAVTLVGFSDINLFYKCVSMKWSKIKLKFNSLWQSITIWQNVHNCLGNALLPDGNKQLSDPILIQDYWHPPQCNFIEYEQDILVKTIIQNENFMDDYTDLLVIFENEFRWADSIFNWCGIISNANI